MILSALLILHFDLQLHLKVYMHVGIHEEQNVVNEVCGYESFYGNVIDETGTICETHRYLHTTVKQS